MSDDGKNGEHECIEAEVAVPEEEKPARTDAESTSVGPSSEAEVQTHATPASNHGEHRDGIAHVVPLRVLAMVFGALVVLTIFTVAVTAIDLGSSTNLTVAMVIATIKASLVIAVFMHLWYDRSINLLLFLTSVLFVILFISLSMMDRAEYQPSIDELEAVQAAAAAEN